VTKRYSARNYVTLFVGFAPVENPRLAILVLLDEPEAKKYGGLVAAPVFREVGAWSLNHLRVLPDVRMVRAEEGWNRATRETTVHRFTWRCLRKARVCFRISEARPCARF